MITQFTLPKRRRTVTAAFILLVSSTGCTPKPAVPSYDVKLSADPKENSYLTSIFLSRNKDSIMMCADIDYHQNKYYIFRTTTPCEGKFDSYLAGYAKQKYKLTLVNCGCKSRIGACYYNAEMAVLVSKARLKSFGAIYIEAKGIFNNELNNRYASH